MISVIVFLLFGCVQSTNGEKDDSTTSESNSGGKIHIPDQSEEDPLTVEEGATVASDVAGSYLHLPQGVEPAGPAVYVKAKDDIAFSEIGTYQLTLALDRGHSLTTIASPNLVVLYQVEDGNGDTVYGLIPRTGLTVTPTSATFDLRGFGNYQAAILPELVEDEVVSDPVAVPILSAETEGELPVITWATPIGNFQAADRSVTLTASFGPSSISMLSCVAILDQNKAIPYTYGSASGSTPNHSFAIANDSAHLAYGFFECIDSRGRTTRSPWSNAISVPVIPAPSWNTTIGAIDVVAGRALSVALAATGAMSYSLKANAMDCDIAGIWSSPVTVDGSSGLITGTPSQVGTTCTVTAAASNVGGAIYQTFPVTIWADPGNICDTDDGTTCTISSVNTLSNLSLLRISGNLVIANAGVIGSNIDESIAIDVGGNLEIRSGGTIAANLIRLHASNIDIQAGGIIHANGLSTYVGSLYSADPTLSGQGASHGGLGGADASANSASAYGLSSQPVTRGALGEAGSAGGAGGKGGGALRLIANSKISIHGTISANGASGQDGSNAGGGGSGGSIWLSAETVDGNGTVTSLGGDGGNGGIGADGSGGAGGRIATYVATNNYVGTMLATAGFAGSGGGIAGGHGADGSVQVYALSALPEAMVFNSSGTFNGNLGGLSGADAKCQTKAQLAGMDGRWKAILSSAEVGAKDRLTIKGNVYDRAGGQISTLANDLWSGSLVNGAATTETGAATNTNAWTGSQSNGTSDSSHCSNWSSPATGGSGSVGDHTSVNGDWLNATTITCNQLQSLYCVSQW